MVAKTFQGLEEVLAQELLRIGAENVETGQRMVSFEGTLETMYKANLCTRTALRILKPIAKFTAEDPDDLYELVRDFDWSKYLSPDKTFAIDSTVSGTKFTHSQYVTYRVKDGIADYFMEHTGRRPSVRLEAADRIFNVHVADNRVTISLDSTGEPLSHRGYKAEQTEAPINEVLAAGIILLSGWRGDVDFLDPMCGSGTFLTEAALIAANINPGIYRKSFAFERWDDFDSVLFEELYNDDSQEREVHVRIQGGDKDPKAVAIARKNIRSAKLESMIEVEIKTFEEWTEMAPEGVIVTNPPYGQRLRPGDLDSLWKMIGRCLKENFKGWQAWILGMTDEQFAEMGLKPTVKIPLHNGSLECSLREFILFAGRYDEFRAAGGSLGRGEEEDAPLDKVSRGRHLNSREWKEETRKFGGGKPRKMRQDFDGDRNERQPRRGGAPREYDDRKRPDRKFNDRRRDDHRRDDRRREERRRDDRRREDRRRDNWSEEPFAKPEFKGKSFERRKSDGYKVSNKGPRISADKEVRFGAGVMRSRRKRDFEEEDD